MFFFLFILLGSFLPCFAVNFPVPTERQYLSGKEGSWVLKYFRLLYLWVAVSIFMGQFIETAVLQWVSELRRPFRHISKTTWGWSSQFYQFIIVNADTCFNLTLWKFDIYIICVIWKLIFCLMSLLKETSNQRGRGHGLFTFPRKTFV